MSSSACTTCLFNLSSVEEESWWLYAADLREGHWEESEDSSEERDDDDDDEEEEADGDGEFDLDSDEDGEDNVDSTLGFNPKSCLLKVDAGKARDCHQCKIFYLGQSFKTFICSELSEYKIITGFRVVSIRG